MSSLLINKPMMQEPQTRGCKDKMPQVAPSISSFKTVLHNEVDHARVWQTCFLSTSSASESLCLNHNIDMAS